MDGTSVDGVSADGVSPDWSLGSGAPGLMLFDDASGEFGAGEQPVSGLIDGIEFGDGWLLLPPPAAGQTRSAPPL
jgi:hypothetical protein